MKLIGVTCISTIQQIAMDGIVADKDGMLFSLYVCIFGQLLAIICVKQFQLLPQVLLLV